MGSSGSRMQDEMRRMSLIIFGGGGVLSLFRIYIYIYS